MEAAPERRVDRLERPERPLDFLEPTYRSALVPIFGTDVDTDAMSRAAALVGLGASAVGLASALSSVAVKKVKVSLKSLGKDAEGMRIVQISDVHVGPTIGQAFIEKNVDAGEVRAFLTDKLK